MPDRQQERAQPSAQPSDQQSSQPPSSSASLHVEAPALPDWVRRSKLAVLALVLAIMPLGSWGACVTGVLDEDDGASIVIWLVSCGLALVGVVAGIVSYRRLEKRKDGRVSGETLSIIAIILGVFSPVLSALLGFFTMDINFGHGRALRRGGKRMVPGDVVVEAAWLRPLRRFTAPPAVARAWRQSGATEAASVTAFDWLADYLAAVGAPSSLIDGARQSAREEEHHARLCYSLAAAVDGLARGPAALDVVRPASRAAAPGDGADLARFAAQNVVESCLFEGAAADVARVLLARDDVNDDVRGVLAVIANDEAGHAAHGWAIVDWCHGTAGAAVNEACIRALVDVDSARVGVVANDGLEKFGVAGPTLWRAALSRERERCLQRLRR